MDKGDQVSYPEEAYASSSNEENSTAQGTINTSETETLKDSDEICVICLDNVNPQTNIPLDFVITSCGHRYCTVCYRNITSHINQINRRCSICRTGLPRHHDPNPQFSGETPEVIFTIGTDNRYHVYGVHDVIQQYIEETVPPAPITLLPSTPVEDSPYSSPVRTTRARCIDLRTSTGRARRIRHNDLNVSNTLPNPLSLGIRLGDEENLFMDD